MFLSSSSVASRRLASRILTQSRNPFGRRVVQQQQQQQQRIAGNDATTTIRSSYIRRWLSGGEKSAGEAAAKETTEKATSKVAAESAAKSSGEEAKKKSGMLYSAEFWGGLGAAAGWGMGLSGIYDAMNSGPEVISLTMTPVLLVYSSLFVRWAWIVKPRNTLLAACHVTNIFSQLNQLRRALQYKMDNGQEQQVKDITQKAAIGGACIAGSILLGPSIRASLTKANLGVISNVAAADAGPFTVHFWAPMSKWMISGASFFDLHRPTDQISLPQYTALTLTGFFFTPYSLLVRPINYTLCSVNIALFFSSAWHLGRKIHADYLS